MSRLYNLIDVFDREIEVLDANETYMIYVIDQKSDRGNLCAVERYDFDTEQKVRLLELPGTRIYESFETYDSKRTYFYAVSVASDYKLHLQKINTHAWEAEEVYWIVPEGEILSIEPDGEEYLFITDEVAATDELLEKVHDEDYEGKYYTLKYRYNIKNGDKTYMHDAHAEDEISEERYTIAELPDGRIQVTDTQNPSRSFLYDEKYGEFSGIYNEDILVTHFYDTEMLKDDVVFKECVAIHHIQEGTVEVYDGRVLEKNGIVLLLKSYLYL